MKCFTKISLVLLSCFTLTKGAALPEDNSSLNLSSLFFNLLGQQQSQATPLTSKTQIAGVTANPTEIDDDYTQEDLRKYTKFLLNFVNNENGIKQVAATTTTTTTTTTTVAAATNLLKDIKNLSSELDQIKERKVGEMDELIDIIKNVSQRLDTLEDTVEQSLAKQEAVADTVDDTKEVDLNNAEVDNNTQTISPINENDLKYAAIFNAFNKKNEEKIAAMQENEIKLLEEIKELLSKNNANASVNVDNSKAIVAADEETKDKEVKPADENTDSKEPTKEETKEKSENSNVMSIDHIKKIINEVASNTTNEEQVEEVQRIIKEIQLNEKAATIEEAANVDEDESVGKALFEVASNTMNDEQVDEVRKFIKSIEAKAIVDENLKKDEVVRKLIYDIAANSTNQEQVHEIQRILGKIQLFNKFAEDTQQERKDNLAFGHEMADEIVKSPEEISNDLKVLLVNLVNNAKTEEEAANVANIIEQIKKHDKLIKDTEKQKEQNETTNYIKVPNVETYMVDLDDGSSNQIYLKENQEFVKTVEKDNVTIIDLEEGIDGEGNGNGLFVLGAFGVIALAGVGYTYRSKAKKLNDEFPFSDNNLPFSNNMNGLFIDKNFLFRKNSIPKPDNIINNDAVIRPAHPSWATSVLMDENNKKGLKEGIQMTEDPEQLLDEQLREIENKEKVIVKNNHPSVVITIDDNNATTEISESSKQKKTVKKPKLRRSMSHISLDKKIMEDRKERLAREEKNRKKNQKKVRKSLCDEKIIEEDEEICENNDLSLNTSFILDAPSLLFDDKETEKAPRRKSLVLNYEKPKVPKRISSCLPESNDILPTVFEDDIPSIFEEEPKEISENTENSECKFTQDFAKELLDDYNKKFGEIETEN